MKKTGFRIRSIWIAMMGLSLILSACTTAQEIKEPDTIDVSTAVMTRVLVNNGESYGDTQSLIMTNPQITAIADLADFEAWVPIFKPIYHYTIGFGLTDTKNNKLEFAIYDNKLLVVVTSYNKIYYFEGPKSIYSSIKSRVDEILQAHLALPEHRDSILVSAMVRNEPIYMGWVNIPLDSNVDMTVLEASLKRDAWLLKDNASKSIVLYAFQLTDSNGLTYRFVEIVGEADQVEIYAAPFVADMPLAIYMVPDQVIRNTQALLQPLIQSEPAGDDVTKAVFVRAYLDMWFFFDDNKMLSEYGYVFTPAQKTHFNKLDSTTWRKLNFEVEGTSAIFALYDSQGNAYFFDVQSDGAMIKRVPKDKSKSPEYYMAPGLDAYQLYLDLLSEYPPKGVLSVVTKAVFTKVEERVDENSEYQLISNLNSTQSNALISVLKYSSWTQKVGFPAGGWWFRYRVTSSTGLIYYFGFDYAVVELPDHTKRIYTLTPEVMKTVSDYFQGLK